jgi:3-hydroxyisobutyrate dehydrogenase-like beta-hydroxyacid dehydrogenase
MFGENGIVAGADEGLVVAIASTVAPHTMNKIAARLPAQPTVALLDIPLCRGEGAAQEGKLLIMGGGDKTAFDACRGAFQTFADSIFHLGPTGAGQVGKMVNNLILWASIAANEEGLKLGAALGVDREELRAALLDSSAANWSLATRPEEKPMPWAEKDMTIVLKEADAARLALPVCGVVKEAIKAVKLERHWPTPKSPED